MNDDTTMAAWERAKELYRQRMGYAPGERLSTPEQIAAALQGVARERPERCVLEEMGVSVQGRPLQLLTVASDENLRRLDWVRESNLALADPSTAEADDLLLDAPATAWVIANVHGDEHSTAEAALALAFYLSEGEDPLLENAVVGIDPLQNPDGRARSVHSFYDQFGIKTRSNPDAAEHWDPWPGGRGNHYMFDMNRDWFPLTQPESRARVSAFLRWRPQVLADLHEMWTDSRFFFPPPAQPLNPHLGAHIHKWWRVLGRNIGAAFDANGWDYWTGEIFDSFYPGYGEAFPTMHGCTGMTFEQAAAAGLASDRRDGTTQTFEDGIMHHFGAALSVCRTAAEHRAKLRSDARAYFTSALDVPAHAPRAYMFPESGAGRPSERIASLLAQQGIAVHRLTEDTSLEADPYGDGAAETRSFSSGCIVVRLDQPEGRAARAILERETAITAEWLDEQKRRLAEDAGTEFYDHTAWSFPVAMGVAPYTVHNVPDELEPWSPVALAGDAPVPRYGFLIAPHGMAALEAAARLMGRNVRVHTARRPFTLEETVYPRGTIVVKKPDQPRPWEDVCAEVWNAARAAGVQPDAADGSWTDNGINLGSDEVVYARPPRVAVLYDAPVSTLSYGWISHLFEQRLDYDFTPLRPGAMGSVDLRRYDVIVLPDAGSETLAARLGDDTWKKLLEWVRQGGTLIALAGAAAAVIGKGKDWSSVKIIKDLRPSAGTQDAKADEEKGDKPKDAKDEPVPSAFKPECVAGAALAVDLDRHHWTTLGFDTGSHVPYESAHLFAPSADGRNVAVFAPQDRLVVAGFVWEKMQGALPGKAYLVDEPHGRGHVLLFADDPNVRGYWDVSIRLFVNAVLFAPVGAA